jgi:hypothetical protein
MLDRPRNPILFVAREAADSFHRPIDPAKQSGGRNAANGNACKRDHDPGFA